MLQSKRNYILKRDNYACQICGTQNRQRIHYDQRDNLEIHHINHSPEDNDYFNLITLCCGCHYRITQWRRNWIYEPIFTSKFNQKLLLNLIDYFLLTTYIA
jgi:5-methylcytosine-specific restriction endonuclease McrA